MTTGVDRPASSFFFHRTLLPSPPSGLHFSTKPFSVETRFCCGPRQFGQSIGSGFAARAELEITPWQHATINKEATQAREPMLMGKKLRRDGVREGFEGGLSREGQIF